MPGRKTASIFLILLLTLSLCLCSAGAVESDPQRTTVRVGFFALDGYHIMDNNGNRSGYGYDVLRLMARYLDLDYEYIGYDKSWDEMLEMLERGDIDLVTSAKKTEERSDRFAFSKPIGSSSVILTIKNDNTAIIAQDYQTYQNIRVGMMSGNDGNLAFADFAAEKGFSYEPVYFDTGAELTQALQDGRVDAATSLSLRRTDKERVIESFSEREFHVMVRKEDTELLSQINYAIDQMNRAEGDWKTALQDKYYTHTDSKNLTFTDQELALIQQYASGEKTLVVTCSMDRKPYSYVEDGEMKGILPDYFAQLADYAGIPYTMRVPTSRAEYTQWQNDHSVDLFIDARASETVVENIHAACSTSYITMRLARVTRRNFNGTIQKLAVAEEQGSTGIEDSLIDGAEILTYATREECLNAVLNGNADATFVYQYTAQEFVNRDGRGILTYVTLSEPTYDYQIVVTSNSSHALAGIFSKCIYAMPDNTMEDIVMRYLSYTAADIDLTTWFQAYPVAAVAIILLVMFLFLLAGMLYGRQKLVRYEIKRAAELEKLTEQAQAANKAKSEFLASMSHDIRTPLNAIVGINNLMANETGLSDKMYNYIAKTNRASRHLLSLINDVLDMSQIESRKITLAREEFNLPDQIEQVDSIIRPQAEAQQQNFEIQVHHLNSPNLLGDSTRLRQILLNLLSNAVKYTPPGGKISLTIIELPQTQPNQCNLQFTVTDNGTGMTPEFLQQVYEPFVRAECSTVSKIQGTGLGLAITKSFVELMQGDIQVTSTLNVGTQFTVNLTFPILNAPKEHADNPNVLNGKHFLCAEDNALNAELLEEILQLYGATCVFCPDGKEAVQVFEHHLPGEYDAILMDIQMPHMDGYQATTAIRHSNHPLSTTIPIIAMTANTFSEDIQHCLDVGMNGHISKPIDITALEKIMRDLSKDEIMTDFLESKE